jgi:1-acyl-sn-glycerol-3-phosphate acyltransferase
VGNSGGAKRQLVGYWITKMILTPLLRLGFRVSSDGRHHVPRRGPAILASNHNSFMDSLFLPLVLHRRITYVAKAEYFDHWKTAWFFKASGQIPIRRGPGSAWRRAIESAAEVLAEGHLFGIYPEGTRSKDGKLHRGHTGIARLALQTGAPVVPIGFVGTDKALPIGRKFPTLFTRVEVRFGPPMRFEVGPDETERMALRRITDEVMRAIQSLSGQEYAAKPLRAALAPPPTDEASPPPEDGEPAAAESA